MFFSVSFKTFYSVPPCYEVDIFIYFHFQYFYLIVSLMYNFNILSVNFISKLVTHRFIAQIKSLLCPNLGLFYILSWMNSLVNIQFNQKLEHNIRQCYCINICWDTLHITLRGKHKQSSINLCQMHEWALFFVLFYFVLLCTSPWELCQVDSEIFFWGSKRWKAPDLYQGHTPHLYLYFSHYIKYATQRFKENIFFKIFSIILLDNNTRLFSPLLTLELWRKLT